MADSKISDLAAVTDVQATDAFVLARAGTSKKITGASLASELGGSLLWEDVGTTVASAQPYAAGTDRLVARLNSMAAPANSVTPIDWTGTSKFQAGTAVSVIDDQIVFVEDGCYSVHVLIPHGITDGDPDVPVSVVARLSLALSGTEWADGDDAAQFEGLEDAAVALSAKYIWCQNAGDTVVARIRIPGAVDGQIGNIYAQIVRLSTVAAGDEFA